MVISVALHSTRKMEKRTTLILFVSCTTRYLLIKYHQLKFQVLLNLFLSLSYQPLTQMNWNSLVKDVLGTCMRREELKTISMAHKAYTLAETKSFSLNSDGTTKFQKKLGGVAVNGMVLCLSEVLDGSAQSMIEQVSLELEKLRDIAHALNLRDPQKLNWTLFTSSTSDSASTQKKFNHLVEQCRERDKAYGPPSFEAIELIENLCAMHLGSNLRKAFLEGMKHTCIQEAIADLSPQQREHDHTDTFIHEFCKVFGKHSVPEYGCGNLTFLDFLAIKLSEDCSTEDQQYYKLCTQVLLERQVGSRYFVSASNASKIFFLAKASVEFLKYTGKDSGNNLE